MTSPTLTLIGKPGCHLCDDARAVATEVGGEFGIEIDELSILDDRELFAQYADEIPVLLLNGKVHNIWRIDPARLRAALTEATA